MSATFLSKRALNTPPSPIRKLAYLAKEAERAGRKVYYLNIGQPDLPSPKLFFEGVANYKEKVLAYELSKGNEALCEEWSRYMNRTLGLSTDPKEFLITTGASEALIFLFMVACDPGDEIIIFDPTYANYIGFASVTGVTLVPVQTQLEEEFALPPAQQILSKISDRTKAILLCSPNNPTGTTYSREELLMILQICEEHNLLFIVDETYRELVYDHRKPLSVFHIDEGSKQTVVVDSLSKRFSLCGARIGSIITRNDEIMRTCLNLAQARLSCSTIDQYAAAQMLAGMNGEPVEEMRVEYQARRDRLASCLLKIPNLTLHKPGGAFYMVVKLPVDDAEKFCTFLLRDFDYNNSRLFLAPAAGFYMANGKGIDKVRMAYVLKPDDLESAVEILGKGLERYCSP